MESGDSLTVSYSQRFENLEAPFYVRPGFVIVPGEYDWGTTSVNFAAHIGRPISGRLTVSDGGFWGGERTTYSGSVTYRVNPHLFLGGSVAHNRVRLPEGGFETTTLSTRVNVNINTNLFTRALIQYNSDTDQITTNLRLNLIHRPGSDLYIVYDERDDIEDGFDAIVRTLIVKVDYLFAF
jgi:hypothetical protein